jgi:peptide/nickel transport system substrate-binding protein
VLQGAIGGALSVPALGRLGSSTAKASPAHQGDGVTGGTMRVAIPGEPPTLDIHQTTAGIVSLITWSMYEPLFTYDESYQLIPMLAESHEVSDDGLINILRLRAGVPFHNGEELTAADVIASITRWGALSGLGQGLLDATDEMREVDAHTIEFHMTEPYGTFTSSLAISYQGCAIYPKSLIDEVGEAPLEDTFIGTGPYRLEDRRVDQFIRFARFDDYAAVEGEVNGYGGHKYQYLNQIDFIPVPDEAARLAGLQAGDYHYISSFSSDQFETVASSPNLVVETLPPGDWDTLVLNWRSPMMGNPLMRQAFQAALDHEPMLLAAHGEGFYRLEPSLMLRESVWASDASADLYNQNNPERAQELLEEAGYDGTPLRLMSTQEYQYLYNIALVAAQQLEAAGFTVDFQTYDWATLVERRSDPELWDAFTTSDPFRPDPTQMGTMQVCQWPGWWCSDETTALMNDLRSESGFETRFPIWESIQENFYTEVPMIKIGDFNSVTAMAQEVGGFIPLTGVTIAFWNMWLDA